MADHISTITEDEDAWHVVQCSCGFSFGPVPGAETAADVWGDHKVEVHTEELRATVEQVRRERDEALDKLAKSNSRQEFYGRDAAHWQRKFQQAEKERDAAYAVIRRLLDWWSPHYVGGQIDSWYQDNQTRGERWEGIADAEVDAIRAARAVPDVPATPTPQGQT